MNLLYLLLIFRLFEKGTLKGFDQTVNIILDDSHERVYSVNQGVEQVVLGLYIIRGDNMYEITFITLQFSQFLLF